ncbi:Uncharacterized protein Rs2_23995 [Raphanus sativus]|nr:Uncharacterized protein Rs2_23995 [Raphanus sativus]
MVCGHREWVVQMMVLTLHEELLLLMLFCLVVVRLPSSQIATLILLMMIVYRKKACFDAIIKNLLRTNQSSLNGRNEDEVIDGKRKHLKPGNVSPRPCPYNVLPPSLR